MFCSITPELYVTDSSHKSLISFISRIKPYFCEQLLDFLSLITWYINVRAYSKNKLQIWKDLATWWHYHSKKHKNVWNYCTISPLDILSHLSSEIFDVMQNISLWILFIQVYGFMHKLICIIIITIEFH